MKDKRQLVLIDFLERTVECFPEQELIMHTKEGYKKYTYKDFYRRVCKLANFLKNSGIKKGERVAVIDYNTLKGYEVVWATIYHGATLHGVNPRLPLEYLLHTINDAEDKLILVGPSHIPILEQVQSSLKTVKEYVILSDQIPDTTLKPVLYYEELMERMPSEYDHPEINEWDIASLNYTAGTTGFPKGVPYSHRACYLVTLGQLGTDSFAISASDTILHVTPMYHAFGWMFICSGLAAGARQVFLGGPFDAELVCKIIQELGVTFTYGVPVIWEQVIKVAEEKGYDLSSIDRLVMAGSPPSVSLVEKYIRKFNILVINEWGMTETIGSYATAPPLSILRKLPIEKKIEYATRQGIAVPGARIKALNEKGYPISWNDKEMGELCIKAPWIITEYWRRPDATRGHIDEDGWLHTGDIVTINKMGSIKIMDRKDFLIKSGGEWISSVEIENKLKAHPAVEQAAVIAIHDPVWIERPLAIVKARNKVGKEELFKFIMNEFPIWWLPDDIVFVEEIPITGVGKIDKVKLKEQFKNYKVDVPLRKKIPLQ